MKTFNLACMAAVVVFLTSPMASAQKKHFDVEFGYEGGGIIFESDVMGIDASGVFEAEFETLNMDGSQVAEDPGFASNFMKGDEAFSVTAGDTIFLNVNQSSTLGSFLTYFNPFAGESGQFEATGANMIVEDNSPNGTTDLLVTADAITGDFSQFLTTSDGSEIDTHVDYILSSGAADGVYGLLLNIESDNLSGDLNDATSDQFWVLFNNGLDEEVFESAVDNFVTTAIPEPSSAIVLSVVALGLVRRKRA